jgi:hypothetical protein
MPLTIPHDSKRCRTGYRHISWNSRAQELAGVSPEARRAFLLQRTFSPHPLTFQAAFNVLEKACEDYPHKMHMDVEINGSRPLDYIIPKFLELAEHSHPKIRARSHVFPTSSPSTVNLFTSTSTLLLPVSSNAPRMTTSLSVATSTRLLFSSLQLVQRISCQQ